MATCSSLFNSQVSSKGWHRLIQNKEAFTYSQGRFTWSNKGISRRGYQLTTCYFLQIATLPTDRLELSDYNLVQSLPDVFEVSSNELADTSEAAALLNPSTAKLAISILGPFLSAFGFLFILRIVMSWYPKLPVGEFPYVLAYAPTEPLLAVTRKVIPPLGGVDVTPVVWFGILSFLNEILVGPQGLLVLLSQQLN